MGVSDMSLMTVTAKDEETDSIECHGPVEHYMDLTPGKVLIVFPEDAHKVRASVVERTATWFVNRTWYLSFQYLAFLFVMEVR